jgi:amino acid transporter
VWVPVAFLVGGAVTVFSVYSYAKLGARYPSRGGAAQFLIRCFGDGVIAGGLNVFQFLGWIIAMALYCTGFAGAQHPSTPGALTPSRSDRLFQILQRGFEITKQTLQVRHGPAAPDQAEFQTIGTVRGWPFDLGA